MEEFELTAEEQRRADEAEEQDAERQLLLQLQHLHGKLARVRRRAARGDKDSEGRPTTAAAFTATATPIPPISVAPPRPYSAPAHHFYPQSRSCSSSSDSESTSSPSPSPPPLPLQSPSLLNADSPCPPPPPATPNSVPRVPSPSSPSSPPMSLGSSSMASLPAALPTLSPRAIDCSDSGILDERITAVKCPRFVDETKKLIVCAVRRPGRLLRSRAGDALVYRPSQSGFKSSVDYIAETNRVQWVAWPGACVEDCATQEAVRKRLETEHCTCPIFVGRDTQSLFEGFCMDTLWPNLHGIPTDFNEKLRPALLQQQYDAYAYMSQLYVEKVCDVYEEGDMVLVYDYELMLLPAQLRRRFPDVTCGFFLHTPFPSSELFQELPVRTSILHGVLGADVIAFNHFDYVRHFQNACTRILGLESYPTFEAERHYSFEYDGRLISLEICPAGIDPNKFDLVLPPDHSTSKTTSLSASEPSHSPASHEVHADFGEVAGGSQFGAPGCAATFTASAVASIAPVTTSGASVSSTASSLPKESSLPPFPSVVSTDDHAEVSHQLRSMVPQQSHLESQEVQHPDRESLKVVELMKQLERRFQRDGGKLVISLDRLDWCKGLPQKLIAMESLYERFPRWRKKVTFFLVVREQDGTLKHDRQLRQMVNRLVGKVNGRFGSADYTPVQYVVRTLSHAEIVALYSVADVALITSIREGVNLSAMEFIACQANVHEELAPWANTLGVDDFIADSDSTSSRYRNGTSASTGGVSQAAARNTSSTAADIARNPGALSPSTTIMAGYREKGVLVYSEFAGCASSFKGRGALVVNPYYADAVADAVQEALTMSRNKKHIVHERLHQYVSEYTSELWAERILRGLVKTSHDVRDRRLYSSQTSCGLQYHGDHSMPHLHHGMHHTGMGHYRHGMLGYHTGASMHGSGIGAVGGLDVVALRTFYERTSKRLLILDYDGALMIHQPLAQLSRPSEELLVALRILCEDPRNTVIIVTGRKRSDVEDWFRCLPRLGLIADHGYWIRPPRLKVNHNDVFGSCSTGETKHNEHINPMLSVKDVRPKREEHQGTHQETCALFPDSASVRSRRQTQTQKDIECYHNENGMPWENPPSSAPCTKGSDGSMQGLLGGGIYVATERLCESIDNVRVRGESICVPGDRRERKENRDVLDLYGSSDVGGAPSKLNYLPSVGDLFELRLRANLSKDHASDVPGGATVEDGTVECRDWVNKGAKAVENDDMVAPYPWSLALTSEKVDLTWMDEVMPILEDFTHRTPGSLIERCECCLTWHYRDTDGDFGISQAKNLQLHFDQMLQRRPVRVSTAAAHKYLSIQPSRVTKGRALNHLLMRLLPAVESAGMVAPSHIAIPIIGRDTTINGAVGTVKEQGATPAGSILSTQPRGWNGDPSFDLVLSISDDRTDEDLHSSWFNAHRRNFMDTISASNVDFEGLFAVTVCGSGKRLPRNTTHSVEDPSEVLLVLNALARKDSIAKEDELPVFMVEDLESVEAHPSSISGLDTSSLLSLPG